MITIVLTGRNDDYGGGFAERLLFAAEHNSGLLCKLSVPHEFLLVEWNPVPSQPLLAEQFVRLIPHSRAIVVPSSVHESYNLNRNMPFHEMPALNTGIRRARGEFVLVNTADILYGETIASWLAGSSFGENALYRAHRIEVTSGADVELATGDFHASQASQSRAASCFYVGAGDFCLASRKLWHRLRGYNELVRFSTRGKDWQFFLSASASGVDIRFVGNVYHIEHADGYAGTPKEMRDTSRAHFGGLWNIEFGLPITNPQDWGFASLSCIAHKDNPNICTLDARGYRLPGSYEKITRQLDQWLTHPEGEADEMSAVLLHGILAACRERRRLCVRVANHAEAVSVHGLAVVAMRFGVDIRCNWEWPTIPGFSICGLPGEPQALEDRDWILARRQDSWQIVNALSGNVVEVMPRKVPATHAPFNPFLARRLLRAYLQLLGEGDPCLIMAIYGAGEHTRNLLRWGIPDTMTVCGIVVSGFETGELCGIPIRPLSELDPGKIDVLLLSSIPYEQEMKSNARNAGFGRIVALYDDWPKDLWRDPRKSPEIPSPGADAYKLEKQMKPAPAGSASQR